LTLFFLFFCCFFFSFFSFFFFFFLSFFLFFLQLLSDRSHGAQNVAEIHHQGQRVEELEHAITRHAGLHERQAVDLNDGHSDEEIDVVGLVPRPYCLPDLQHLRLRTRGNTNDDHDEEKEEERKKRGNKKREK
jgi:hypothetical protein